MAFFVREADDRFAATEYARGPWDAGAQHQAAVVRSEQHLDDFDTSTGVDGA